jgi:hypothetical protein
LGQVNISDDFEGGGLHKRTKRQEKSDWNGYYLGDIWSTRSGNDNIGFASRTSQSRNPPSEVI